jgi:guanine deaminase
MKAYRGSVLRFDSAGQALWDEDGLLVVGPDPAGQAPCWVVRDVGDARTLLPHYAEVPLEDCRGQWLVPGFVDMHVHYPQTDIIGSPADGLLPWLQTYTFPQESRFSDALVAQETAHFFVSELMRHGVTTALCFATSHPQSVDALMQAGLTAGMRLITGKVLQDQHSPTGVRDQTEQSLVDTEALIQRWQGQSRLGYAITPRFVPTSSAAQLRGAGELAARYPEVWVQSHVAENRDEIAWVAQMYPQQRSYLSVYDHFGLLRERAVYAHGIYLDSADRALLGERGAAIAVSPTSNLFLGSGFFDFSRAQGFAHGLASDVGGGTSFSPFATMRAAYFVAREGLSKAGVSLSPEHLWWLHTAGAAAAIGLPQVGNLQVGCEADVVLLNPQATPLLARRMDKAQTVGERLFAMVVLGDDRAVVRTDTAPA